MNINIKNIIIQFVLLFNTFTNAYDCQIIEELLKSNSISFNWAATNTTGCCGYEGIQCVNESVTYIELNGKNLKGNLDSLMGLSSLQYINLSNNEFTGAIPSSIKALTNLQFLYLNKNKLTGSIPNEIAISQMQFLYLSGNELEGAIPSSLGRITNLQHLDLSNNKLSGSVPSSFGQLKNIQYLKLTNNENLCGELPILSDTLKTCDFGSTSLCVNNSRDHCISNAYTTCSNISCSPNENLDNQDDIDNDIDDELEENHDDSSTSEKILKWVAIGILILIILGLIILQMICLRRRYKKKPKFDYNSSINQENKEIFVESTNSDDIESHMNNNNNNNLNENNGGGNLVQPNNVMATNEQDISGILPNQGPNPMITPIPNQMQSQITSQLINNAPSALMIPFAVEYNNSTNRNYKYPTGSNTISGSSPQLHINNNIPRNDNNHSAVGLAEINKHQKLSDLTKMRTQSNPNLYYYNRQSYANNMRNNRNSYNPGMEIMTSNTVNIQSPNIDKINRTSNNNNTTTVYPLSSQTISSPYATSPTSNRVSFNNEAMIGNGYPSAGLSYTGVMVRKTPNSPHPSDEMVQRNINGNVPSPLPSPLPSPSPLINRKNNSVTSMKNMKSNMSKKNALNVHHNSYPSTTTSNTSTNATTIISSPTTNKRYILNTSKSTNQLLSPKRSETALSPLSFSIFNSDGNNDINNNNNHTMNTLNMMENDTGKINYGNENANLVSSPKNLEGKSNSSVYHSIGSTHSLNESEDDVTKENTHSNSSTLNRNESHVQDQDQLEKENEEEQHQPQQSQEHQNNNTENINNNLNQSNNVPSINNSNDNKLDEIADNESNNKEMADSTTNTETTIPTEEEEIIGENENVIISPPPQPFYQLDFENNMRNNSKYNEYNEYRREYSNYNDYSNYGSYSNYIEEGGNPGEGEGEIIPGQDGEMEGNLEGNMEDDDEQQPPNYDEVLSETLFSPMIHNTNFIETNDESIRMQLEMRRIEERQLRVDYLQRQINNPDLAPEQRQRYIDALDRLMLED